MLRPTTSRLLRARPGSTPTATVTGRASLTMTTVPARCPDRAATAPAQVSRDRGAAGDLGALGSPAGARPGSTSAHRRRGPGRRDGHALAGPSAGDLLVGRRPRPAGPHRL